MGKRMPYCSRRNHHRGDPGKGFTEKRRFIPFIKAFLMGSSWK
jgi:hypothetical protein